MLHCAPFSDPCIGQVKVIIVPHDANALRGSDGIPCDAYCKKLNGAFLDFYSLDECGLYLSKASN